MALTNRRPSAKIIRRRRIFFAFSLIIILILIISSISAAFRIISGSISNSTVAVNADSAGISDEAYTEAYTSEFNPIFNNEYLFQYMSNEALNRIGHVETEKAKALSDAYTQKYPPEIVKDEFAFVYPVKDRRITSDFKKRREFDMNGERIIDGHYGTDYVSTSGDVSIKAICNGYVCDVVDNTSAEWFNFSGNSVIIGHKVQNKVFYTFYFHLASTPKWEKGDFIKAGDQVGIMGTTGFSLGVHLHFHISTVNFITRMYPQSDFDPKIAPDIIIPEEMPEAMYFNAETVFKTNGKLILDNIEDFIER